MSAYKGSNMIRGYANRFIISKEVALDDLRKLGYPVSYREMSIFKKNNYHNQDFMEDIIESNDIYYYIAG
jgi:hypothetical protein